jgi:hypothetical protein
MNVHRKLLEQYFNVLKGLEQEKKASVKKVRKESEIAGVKTTEETIYK